MKYYYDKYLKYKKKYLNCKSITAFRNSIDLIKESTKSFNFVDIEFTNDEIIKIKLLNMNPKNSDTFNYFGIYKYDMLKKMTSDFITSLDNEGNISNTISKLLIKKIVSPFLKAMSKDSLWFTIRVMFADEIFDIPRWHSDGYFYKWEELSQKEETQLKLAGTLIGPGTLFKLDNNDMITKYNKISEELHQKNKLRKRNMEIEIDNRKIIAEALKSYDQIQPKNNQVAIFSVGDRYRSTVHSEPPINTKRFFFSIVAGNVEEIKDLAKRWNEKFYENSS